MRSVNLLKVAAAAETLRYCCTLARQGRRAAFGASGADKLVESERDRCGVTVLGVLN